MVIRKKYAYFNKRLTVFPAQYALGYLPPAHKLNLKIYSLSKNLKADPFSFSIKGLSIHLSLVIAFTKSLKLGIKSAIFVNLAPFSFLLSLLFIFISSS